MAPDCNQQVVTWIFVAICNIAFAARAYFRYTCLRRLLVEDYLMLLALAIYDAQAILIQLSLQSAYELEAVEMVDLSKTTQPDIFTDLRRGTVTVGTSYILIIVGVLVIKLNLLLFFRRLDVKAYKTVTILWWIVLNFTVAGAMAQIAVLKLDCIFGSIEHIFGGACSTESTFQRNLVIAIFSSTVDAVSDLLSESLSPYPLAGSCSSSLFLGDHYVIGAANPLTRSKLAVIAFPVAILWRSRISMRKKLALTFIFSLAFLTIAITIVRGSVFHSTRATAAVAWTKRATFIWFWYYCEFSVGKHNPESSPVCRSQIGQGESDEETNRGVPFE